MNRPFYELHQDFVAAARAASRAAYAEVRLPDPNKTSRQRKLRALRAFERFSCAVYGFDDPCGVLIRDNSPESQRMQRLADLVGYRGPILGGLQ